ncbi:MAG: hypothetical protein ACFFER_18660 [Candidatus Thorarchaeota archaeon]
MKKDDQEEEPEYEQLTLDLYPTDSKTNETMHSQPEKEKETHRMLELRRRKKKLTISDAMNKIGKTVEALGLPKETRELAFTMFRRARARGLARKLKPMVGAVVYAACRLTKHPRPLNLVAEISGAKVTGLSKAFRKIAQGMDEQIPISSPEEVLPWICEQVKASNEVENKSSEILIEARSKGLIEGRDPWGLAAAALYISSLLLGIDMTQVDIAKAACVTEVTVRNRYKELVEVLNIQC